MYSENNRINREKQTVEAMIRLFCRDKHDSKGELCANCLELLNYSLKRLDSCKFGSHKPACGNCTLHCYLPARRQEIVKVMRYSGPKMLLKHPVLAFGHILDSFKNQ